MYVTVVADDYWLDDLLYRFYEPVEGAEGAYRHVEVPGAEVRIVKRRGRTWLISVPLMDYLRIQRHSFWRWRHFVRMDAAQGTAHSVEALCALGQLARSLGDCHLAVRVADLAVDGVRALLIAEDDVGVDTWIVPEVEGEYGVERLAPALDHATYGFADALRWAHHRADGAELDPGEVAEVARRVHLAAAEVEAVAIADARSRGTAPTHLVVDRRRRVRVPGPEA